MPDLLWRPSIHLSIRGIGGWHDVRGDLLLVEDVEAISVHPMGGGWSITHHRTGARICGLPTHEQARRVAEALAAKVEPSVWSRSDHGGDWAAKHIAPVLWPLIAHRKVWLRGRWLECFLPPEVAA